MIDTLTLSRELTKVGIPSAHADAIATGIQQATDHGDHVTASSAPDGEKTDLRLKHGRLRRFSHSSFHRRALRRDDEAEAILCHLSLHEVPRWV